MSSFNPLNANIQTKSNTAKKNTACFKCPFYRTVGILKITGRTK